MPSLFDHTFSLHKAGGFDINFEISDEDVQSDIKYWGYLAYNGSWLIQRYNTTLGTYRYATGQFINYDVAWAARASLDYDYYNIMTENVK